MVAIDFFSVSQFSPRERNCYGNATLIALLKSEGVTH